MVDRQRPVARDASRQAMKDLTFEEAVDKDLADLAKCGVTGKSVTIDCNGFHSK